MNSRPRWGAPVFRWSDASEWVARHVEAGYRAAYWPDPSPADQASFVRAAASADLVIAEVGAWSNPLSPDPSERQRALELCRERLALADDVGAACCVNLAGTRSSTWNGPHADNFNRDTFDQIVQTVRSIIDEVKPKRTAYTLELMPTMWPWDADSYLELLRAIDRPAFAVHLDPANTMVSPRQYFQSAAVYQELFAKLGPWIRSCHVKDLQLGEGFPVQLDEVPLTTGGLDLRAYVALALRQNPDLPLMLEHLPDEPAYRLAAERVMALTS